MPTLESPPVDTPRLVTVRLSIKQMAAMSRVGRGDIALGHQDLVGLKGSKKLGDFLMCPMVVKRAIVRNWRDRPELWGQLAYIVQHESGNNPKIHVVDRFIIRAKGDGTFEVFRRPKNDADIPDGFHVAKEDSRGLFQVNVNVHSWARRGLFNPDVNGWAARRIFDAAEASSRTDHNGFFPWTTARNARLTSKRG